MKQEITFNFVSASNCEALRLTSQLLGETQQKGELEGRKYMWTPLIDDYWLPEKEDFDYEIQCPIFKIVRETSQQNNAISVYATFSKYQQKLNVNIAFIRVTQLQGETNLEELFLVSRLYAYLRFSFRDYYRESDQKWWNLLFEKNVISNDTTLVFTEDKYVAKTWAETNFPQNSYNAWIGKIGEFIFSSWAGEYGIDISRVDLNSHPEGDEYDFLHITLLMANPSNVLKLDIKTFQLEHEQNRNWWNVSENCLQGDHRQDIIIFVILDQEMKMGKVVGYLSSDEILEKSKYHCYDEFSSGYYRVYLKQLHNTYHLRCLLDRVKQSIFGFAGFAAINSVTEIIKDYPLDPITAYSLGYDWRTFQRGGTQNIIAKPSLKMLMPLKYS